MTDTAHLVEDAPGASPWRGIMSPSVLHLINILEDMGHYEPPLSVPGGVTL